VLLSERKACQSCGRFRAASRVGCCCHSNSKLALKFHTEFPFKKIEESILIENLKNIEVENQKSTTPGFEPATRVTHGNGLTTRPPCHAGKSLAKKVGE